MITRGQWVSWNNSTYYVLENIFSIDSSILSAESNIEKSLVLLGQDGRVWSILPDQATPLPDCDSFEWTDKWFAPKDITELDGIRGANVKKLKSKAPYKLVGSYVDLSTGKAYAMISNHSGATPKAVEAVDISNILLEKPTVG